MHVYFCRVFQLSGSSLSFVGVGESGKPAGSSRCAGELSMSLEGSMVVDGLLLLYRLKQDLMLLREHLVERSRRLTGLIRRRNPESRSNPESFPSPPVSLLGLALSEG